MQPSALSLERAPGLRVPEAVPDGLAVAARSPLTRPCRKAGAFVFSAGPDGRFPRRTEA